MKLKAVGFRKPLLWVETPDLVEGIARETRITGGKRYEKAFHFKKPKKR